MDRSREVRRSNMAATNGLPKRRQRSSNLRQSHEEEGQLELQDTVRLRDRANKRERDRDRDAERDRDRYRDREYSNQKIQNKRRRGDSLTQGNNGEGEEESTEESVADEEDYEIEERRVSHTNSHNTATSFSSSLSNQNSRKSLPPNRTVRQSPGLKAADELIGASVPRKARSASVKRSHENWVNGNGGFWEDHKTSTSPASRNAEANSPSSSNVSVRKKMKPNGPKTRLPKVTKSSNSSVQQEDIEIEIAEVLYGLMKQSQNSKKDDDNITKLEAKDTNGISQDTKSSTSVLAQSNSSTSDLLPDGADAATKKKKIEVDNPSILVQNGSITSAVKVKSETHEKKESCPTKLEITSKLSVESCEASHEIDVSKVTSMTVEPQEEVTKQSDSKPSIVEESRCSGGPVTEKKSISAEEESATCLKMDSTVTKAASTGLENENRKEEKFKIDLMAPPPMASSPERDGFNDFPSDPSANDVKMKSLTKDEEKAERFVKKEPLVEEVEEKKMGPIGDKSQCQLKIDLEKPNQENEEDSSVKLHQQSQKQQQLQPKSTIPKVEKTAQSSSLPLQLAVTDWPNGLPPMGYMPPFQTVMPMDGSARLVTAQQNIQPPPFILSQPRPKRCATHCYIARNICLNQQLPKMNPFWPSVVGSASASQAKPSNLNVPSTENIIHSNPPQGGFPVLNLNSGPDKGQVVANFPGLIQKDKSSEGINFMDPAQRKQLVIPQAPHPAPAGNMLHGPAFIFPVSQQQAAVKATANQPGPSKCAANSTKSSAAAVPASSTALPAVAAAVSYNYTNLAANEGPYLTILQSNGYPFPVPAPIGTPPANRGGTHGQTLPFFSGSFYSSQIFHPSQLQHQQQPHSQPLMQAAHQNTSTSSGSSLSHKQLHCQQPMGMPVSGNDFMSSASMQSQQLQKQLVSSSNQNRMLEAEIGGENTPSVTGSRPSHNQTTVYGQNFSVPLQPLNFTLMSSPAIGSGSTGGNHSEKPHQSQQKSLSSGVELIPQAFAMSFASFGGGNSASNLNFSSMPPNPAIFQNLSDTARQGYRVASATQAASQKNHQISEMKTGGGSSNHDESKKPSLGKSPAANAQTLVFDDSARTLNFVSSPVPGSWPSRVTTSAAITTNIPISTNPQNFQQPQLLQLKQQMLQQQQQPPSTARSKAPTSNGLPSSTITAKLSTNSSIFQQNLVQGNSSSQSPLWKNSTRSPTSQVPPTSLPSSSIATLKNVSQQQVRSPQGHTQISFERHSRSGLAPQGQQIPTNQSSSAQVVGSPPSGGNLRSSSTGSKAGSSIPTLQSQQTENSSASTGQKSSPVCGRNVPSILSTCPSHLSELKY